MDTERLKIYPATREQMEALIAAERDRDLRAAYTEMLEGCLRNPDQWDWFAMWMIERRDGTHIGDLCFKGLSPGGVTEIGYGILEGYRGQGYATEAVKAALDWAFGHPEVMSVEAETDAENVISKRVLVRCGFTPDGQTGAEGPRFVRRRFKPDMD